MADEVFKVDIPLCFHMRNIYELTPSTHQSFWCLFKLQVLTYMGHFQAKTLYKNTERQFPLLSVHTEISIYKMFNYINTLCVKILVKSS